jgi:biopolymer transport protein ExbD
VAALPSNGTGIRLDMTPMVDVAFLLLIFFMSTTALKAQEEAEIVLPTSAAGEEMPRQDRLVVTVSADGSVGVSSPGRRAESVPIASVGERVKTAAAGAPGARLVVYADGDVPYATMTEVFRSLRDKEIYQMSLITDAEEPQVRR